MIGFARNQQKKAIGSMIWRPSPICFFRKETRHGLKVTSWRWNQWISSSILVIYTTMLNINNIDWIISSHQNVFKCKQTWFDMTTWWNCAVNRRNRPLARKCLNTNSYDHEMTHDQKLFCFSFEFNENCTMVQVST